MTAGTAFPRGTPFWDRVAMGDGCWEWQGGRNTAGYGCAYRSDRLVLAHRWAWELERGPIPAGLHVCHHCDNPPCVRPDHLFVGTDRDNVRDSMAKGRYRPPPRTPRLYTPHQVRELKRRYTGRFGEVTALAKELGINLNTAYQILAGRTWKGETP